MTNGPPASVTLTGRFREFLQRYPRGGALFFTRRVNRPIGSFIAAALFDTRFSPNMVSVAGLVVHAAAAGLLALSPDPIAPWVWVAVIVLWQVAFGLDCADGQLARARAMASPFGAWLDIFLDVVNHVIVYGALGIVVTRALDLDGPSATVVTTIVMGGHLIQLITSWGHAELGSDPAVPDPPAWLRLSMAGRHLLDYGWFLFAASVLLGWPVLLLGFLILSSALHVASALAQLALNWRRELAGGAPARPGTRSVPSAPGDIAGDGSRRVGR